MTPIRALATMVLVLTLAAGGCARGPGGGATSPAAGLRIVSVTADPDTVSIYGQSVLTSAVDNPRGGALSYGWSAYRGSIVEQGPSARYFGSPNCCLGTDWVLLTVRNDRGEQDTHLLTMTVLPD